MRLIFSERFSLMHIPISSMGKFLSLAQFPMDNLSLQIVPSLGLILCQLTPFIYFVINRSSTSHLNPRIFHPSVCWWSVTGVWISWEFPPFWVLKYPYNCFSFHFCFLFIAVLFIFMLSVLFLVAVIHLPFLFLMQSTYWCIRALLNAGELSSSFFPGIYDLFMSPFQCNTKCIVISFLVLWSICLSSLLVHFKNVPEDLRSGTVQVFITLTEFLLKSLDSRNFLIQMNYF